MLAAVDGANAAEDTAPPKVSRAADGSIEETTSSQHPITREGYLKGLVPKP